MTNKPPTIRELKPERLPRDGAAATTDRPVSDEARRTIAAVQRKLIRRARGK